MRAAILPNSHSRSPRGSARSSAGIGSHGCIIGAFSAVGRPSIRFGMIQVPLRAERKTASAPLAAISHASSQPVLPIPITTTRLPRMSTGVPGSR
jgi:hypothetical protein